MLQYLVPCFILPESGILCFFLRSYFYSRARKFPKHCFSTNTWYQIAKWLGNTISTHTTNHWWSPFTSWSRYFRADIQIHKGVFGTVPVFSVPVLMSYRTYRSVRYRYYWYRTELTEVSETGIVSYRTYRIVRYRYWCRTELTEVYSCRTELTEVVLISHRTYRSVRYRYLCRTVVAQASGTGILVVPNLTKCPLPVLMLYRTYRSALTLYRT